MTKLMLAIYSREIQFKGVLVNEKIDFITTIRILSGTG